LFHIVALQAAIIGITYSKGALLSVWSGANSTLKAGHACTYASAGMGVVNSPVVVYKERQLTKEDSEFIHETLRLLSFYH
jgi:hypothetical protein